MIGKKKKRDFDLKDNFPPLDSKIVKVPHEFLSSVRGT
jgi:hypothetical protein